MADQPTQDDAQLIARCATGDPEAFDELYVRFGEALYATAWRMLGNPQEAEDVVQDVFVKLFHSAPQRPIRYPAAWLRRVTANLCIDRIRARGRRELQLLDPATPAVTPTRGSAGIDLERALRALPERARTVFVLHDVEGFRHREIAELLEISEGTSKSQLFRARGLLRKAMGVES